MAMPEAPLQGVSDHLTPEPSLSVGDALLIVPAFAIWFPALEVGSGAWTLSISELSIVLLLPLLFRGRLYREALDPRTLLAIFALLVIATLSAFQLTYVDDKMACLGILTKFGLCLVYICAVLGASRRDHVLGRSLSVFAIGGSLSLAIANLDYFFNIAGGITYAHTGHSRSQGFFEHPNQYAIFVIALLPLVMLTVRSRLLALAAVLNIGAALLLSGSKFSLLLFFVIAWLCIGIRCRIRTSVQVCVGGLLILLFSSSMIDGLVRAMNLVNPRYSAAFQGALGDPLDSKSYLDRVALWGDAWHNSFQNPFFGIGGGQAYTILPFTHAHNLELQYFLTHGVLGVASLLAVFLATFSLSFKGTAPDIRTSRLRLSLLLALVGIFVSDQVSDSMAGQQILLFGFLVGLILSAGQDRLLTTVPKPLPRRTGLQPSRL